MANFCGNCGFPLGANVAFCSNCGAKHSIADNPAAAPVQPGPAPAASGVKSGSGLKILLVVFACLGLMGIVIAGSLYYAVYKVKQTVVQKAHEYGVDLPAANSSASTFSRKAHLRKPCDYLSKQQAADLLGEPIERTTVEDAACLYFGPPGLAAKLGQEQVSAVIKRAQTPGGPASPDINGTLNQLAGSLGAATGQTGTGGEAPLLTVVVAEDGKVQMTALMANKALFGGIGKAASEGKAGFGEDIAGLGDRAVRMPPLGLNVLQGEILVRIVPGPVPGGDAKSIEIARTILREL